MSRKIKTGTVAGTVSEVGTVGLEATSCQNWATDEHSHVMLKNVLGIFKEHMVHEASPLTSMG